MSEREYHGLSGRPEYRIWLQIRQACSNPNDIRWETVGGRGIRVCSEWDSFPQFLRDVGRRPSKRHELVRLYLDQDYVPGNVVWRKRKGSFTHPVLRTRVTLSGVTKSIGEWALDLGISREALWKRVRRGWPVGDLLAAPGIPKKVVDPL